MTMIGKKHSEETKEKIRIARARQLEPRLGANLTHSQIQVQKDSSAWRGKTGVEHSKSIRGVCVYGLEVIVRNSMKELAEHMKVEYGLPYGGVHSGWRSNGIPAKWKEKVVFVGHYDDYLELMKKQSQEFIKMNS